MPQLQDLPVELFLDIIEYATRGQTFAEAAYLRKLNGRFRDRIAELYIHHERLLDMKISSASCSTWPTYANIHHFPLEIAVDLIRHWWRDESVVDPRFAHCVNLIEQRMCILFPSLSHEQVHTTFCELFVRLSQIHRQRSAESDHTLPFRSRDPPTVRSAFLDFTQQAFYGTKTRNRMQFAYGNGSEAAERIHGLSLEDIHAELDVPPISCRGLSSIQLMDSIVMIAALALGLADSRNEIMLQAIADSKTFISVIPILSCTPLSMSANMGQCHFARHMLHQTSAPDRDIEIYFNDALRDAALNAHHSVVEVILEDDRARKFLKPSPYTGLIQSCFSGSERCLEMLLAFHDSEPKPPSSRQLSGWNVWDNAMDLDGRSDNERLLTQTLITACTAGTTSAIIGRLLISGAQVNGSEPTRMRVPSIGVPNWPKTAIALAVRNGFKHLVRKLVHQGANVSGPDLIINATEGGILYRDDLEMLETLHDFGVDVAAPRAMVLPQAARRGARRIVEWLLENFPDRAWGNKADLVLYNAAEGDQIQILRLVLSRGKSMISDHQLDAVAARTVDRGRAEVLIELIQHGAKFEKVSKSLAAIDLLRREGKAEFVPLLKTRCGDEVDE